MEDKGESKRSEIKLRIKIQELISKNIRNPLAMFHGKELNEEGFINDLNKNFVLKPKRPNVKIEDIINKNMKVPIGLVQGKELNERNFVNSLFKEFDIIPKM